jgi:hypothetical protein
MPILTAGLAVQQAGSPPKQKNSSKDKLAKKRLLIRLSGA